MKALLMFRYKDSANLLCRQSRCVFLMRNLALVVKTMTNPSVLIDGLEIILETK